MLIEIFSLPQASGMAGLAGWGSSLAGWASGLAGWPRGGNGRTYERTNERKISPFYRTSSPIGAAALPPPMKTKEKVEQGKGTADHLMPLGYLFYSSFFHFPFYVKKNLLSGYGQKDGSGQCSGQSLQIQGVKIRKYTNE